MKEHELYWPSYMYTAVTTLSSSQKASLLYIALDICEVVILISIALVRSATLLSWASVQNLNNPLLWAHAQVYFITNVISIGLNIKEMH